MAPIGDSESIQFNENNHTKSSISEPESLNVIVTLTVAYSLIFVTGILGNTTTCIVIGRNRVMHTATNFYLFSLAISDLILLIFGLPLEMYRLYNPFVYPLGEELCIATGMISETSANATVLTIAAFTIERYIAICRPFMSHKMSKLSRAVKYIIFIWMFAVSFAVPQVMQYGIVTHKEIEQTTISCTVKGHGVHQVFVISSFVFFVVPMSLITILYVLISIKLHKSRAMQARTKSSVQIGKTVNGIPSYKKYASQRRVIKMLVAVALAFFLCWAPFHMQRLIAIYGKNLEHPTDGFYQVYEALTNISGVLYFLSTAINPFLYNIMSDKFRNAFKATLSICCRRQNKSNMERTYSSLLESKKQVAEATPSQRSRNTRRMRSPSTNSFEIFNPPLRPQSLNQSHSAIVHVENECFQKRRLAERPEALKSPQSISNSSLREVDQELNKAELATYLYQIATRVKIVDMVKHHIFETPYFIS